MAVFVIGEKGGGEKSDWGGDQFLHVCQLEGNCRLGRLEPYLCRITLFFEENLLFPFAYTVKRDFLREIS